MSALPEGTVTFLFTDIEGSTRRWEDQASVMQAALARHDALLRASIEGQGGTVFKTVGDAFYAVFDAAPDALDAALAGGQRVARRSGVLRAAAGRQRQQHGQADVMGSPHARILVLRASLCRSVKFTGC